MGQVTGGQLVLGFKWMITGKLCPFTGADGGGRSVEQLIRITFSGGGQFLSILRLQ